MLSLASMPNALRLLLVRARRAGRAQLAPRENAIQPELIAEGPAIPGGEVELAILMHTKPGWHGYWVNPGDAGLPMTIEWQLPPGAGLGRCASRCRTGCSSPGSSTMSMSATMRC